MLVIIIKTIEKLRELIENDEHSIGRPAAAKADLKKWYHNSIEKSNITIR